VTFCDRGFHSWEAATGKAGSPMTERRVLTLFLVCYLFLCEVFVSLHYAETMKTFFSSDVTKSHSDAVNELD